ncbi:MAG: hypothetical protein E5X80_28205 [Mesorhizobium sp.]|uniref:hypothetical protein n=1 Tax=Mesorhizobium sp. TaxID=1871066 RepID=UPI0011FB3BCF|nr:hypothetical protein [Mesorhizobium sp.]TIO48382.1 MAG: hypothetical protein E5X78_29410 [Mesorhizobium sp.]TIO56733.1 MAG: hypothetical protein E5X79_29175 [Mesorhizobium sp.]TJV58384.1 MAG: hypothetical protein E5X80_28205 [Mesorhizobium sp.]
MLAFDMLPQTETRAIALSESLAVMRGFPARPSRKTSNPASDEEDTVSLDAAPNYLTRQAWREENQEVCRLAQPTPNFLPDLNRPLDHSRD